jgi:hypothetical protein
MHAPFFCMGAGMKKSIIILAMAFYLTHAQSAYAQAFVGLGFTPPYNPSNDIIARQLNDRNDNPPTQRDRTTETQRVVANSSSLSFQPSLATRKRNLAQFVSKSRAADPAGAAQLEQLLASTDVIGAMGQALAPYGLKTNNVADVYAVYWITAWEASRSIVSSTNSRGRIEAVKKQAASALLATPVFTNATSAQKQEMAEAMLIQAAMIEASVQKYSSDRSMLAEIAAAVTKGASAMGLDLNKMTLSEQGFKYSGKIGAVDEGILRATPDAAAQQLASAPAPAENDNTTNYALIAAAGGAGLAGVFLAGKAMGKKG